MNIFKERTSPAGVAPPAGAATPVAVKEAAVQLRRDMVQQQVWSCCLNCMDWVKVAQFTADGLHIEFHKCGRYNAVPPPEVIVVGCVEYERDIPF